MNRQDADTLASVAVDLITPSGVVVGQSDKLQVHEPPGMLHRAVSVVLLREDGDVLIQRRAAAKYHFAGWWANACCTHPRPGEPGLDAATRCAQQELGLDVELDAVGSFVYWAVDPVSGRVEHEHDEVFVGVTGSQPMPDPDEVDELRWIRPDALSLAMPSHRPFAPWAFTAIALGLNHQRQPSRAQETP